MSLRALSMPEVCGQMPGHASRIKVSLLRRVPPCSAVVSAGSLASDDESNRKNRFGILSTVGMKALSVVSASGAMAQRRGSAAGPSKVSEEDARELNAQIKESVKSMRMLAMVIPFAAVSGSTDTFFIITKAVASFIKLYLLLLFVRVLLSWFPTFTKWEEQPWLALRQVTDPYLKLFSGLVPPLLGTIDLTPLFGFFILQFLGGALDVTDDESKFWP